VDEFETLTPEDDGDGDQPRGESPSPVTANGSRPDGTGHDRTAVVIESDFLLPDGTDPPEDLQHYCQTRHTDDECDDEPDR
jgi:hypothetical protein